MIAEFMGWWITNDGNNDCMFNGVSKYCLIANLKYHSSWDWIMPVVEKIETLVLHKGLKDGVSAFTVVVSGDWCEIKMNTQYGMAFPEVDFDVITASAKTKIEATWEAVVRFVQWYASYTALKKPREAKPKTKAT